MSNQEFSYEFDIYYNNIMSNQAPGLDMYEKSVFLTKAQEDIIINYYSGKNQLLDSFEKTEEIRRYLSTLISTKIVNFEKDSFIEGTKAITSNSYIVDLSNIDSEDSKPITPWFITYEAVVDMTTKETIPVVPVTQDEFSRIKENPFRNSNNNRILRLDTSDGSKNMVELILPKGIEVENLKYLVRYIRKPSPIILGNLPDGLTINGISNESECKLNPVIHRAILDYAVTLAKMAWNGQTK